MEEKIEIPKEHRKGNGLFLEDLNRGMANRGGKHLVDYQGRHVKTK